MVVGGLPVRISDHANQVATMALDLLYQSGRFKIRHLPYTPLRLRIGIHTGIVLSYFFLALYCKMLKFVKVFSMSVHTKNYKEFLIPVET